MKRHCVPTICLAAMHWLRNRCTNDGRQIVHLLSQTRCLAHSVCYNNRTYILGSTFKKSHLHSDFCQYNRNSNKRNTNIKRITHNATFCLILNSETTVSAYWPVSAAATALWARTAVRYVSAELWAFGPAMDLGDACGGMKGTFGDLAHHSYPQALLVAVAYLWALAAVKNRTHTQKMHLCIYRNNILLELTVQTDPFVKLQIPTEGSIHHFCDSFNLFEIFSGFCCFNANALLLISLQGNWPHVALTTVTWPFTSCHMCLKWT